MFRTAYLSALREYLGRPTEQSLTVAYELGREAVQHQLSVLDLALAHQEGLAEALAGAGATADAPQITRAAGEFLLESLSSFEMVHRGATEARDSVAEQRRRTALSRRLSTLLADSSLALQSYDSLSEILQLAADQGREIVGADCCLATMAARGVPRAAEAVSHPEPQPEWLFLRWLDLPGIYRLMDEGGGSLRLAGEAAARPPLSTGRSGDRPVRRWLGVSLAALDGTRLGALQAFDRRAGEFSDDDEAALVHLAQLVSGTMERMRLYAAGGPH